jgi:hypothetical protein
MSSTSSYGVFISYSHQDAKLVTPLVRLLRYERNDLIFHDKQDIRDGEPWEPQLLQRLNEVHTVMVFWCRHSAQSEYVRKEYLQGIAQHKKILPVILDETTMATELAAYQGIDFRESGIHASTVPAPQSVPAPAPAPAPASAPPPPGAPGATKGKSVTKRLDKKTNEANIVSAFPEALAKQVLKRLSEIMPAK